MSTAITGSSTFASGVATAIRELGFHESTWKSDIWKNLLPMIDQTTLDEAFSLNDRVLKVFSDLGKVSARGYSKTMERVQQKIQHQHLGYENYFEVVSDFIAVEVICEVTEIQAKTDRLREIVLQNKGTMHIKNSSAEFPYGPYTISLLAYVSLPEITPYPIEVQVVHEFAAQMFHEYVGIRCRIDAERKEDAPFVEVNLYELLTLYDDLYYAGKDRILKIATDKDPGPKEPLIAKALEFYEVSEIHQGTPLSDHLKNIVDRI